MNKKMSSAGVRVSIVGMAAMLLPTTASASMLTSPDVALLPGMLLVTIYGALGIFLALISYKLIDAVTPGRLGEELTQKQNLALAVVTGSMILGICIIIAAAIAG